MHKLVEQMWLSWTLNGKKLVIGTAYRPPWMDVDLFFDAITDSITSISYSYDYFILLGDFNINCLNTHDGKTTKFMTFLTCFGLSQIVTEPTHLTETSSTLIDVVCTDLRPRSTTLESVGLLFGHRLVSCEFNIKCIKPRPFTLIYRPLKNISLEKFNTDLQSIDWDLLSSFDKVDDMVANLNYFIISLFDCHAPIKSIIIKHRSYPWITDTVQLMMSLRDQAAADYHNFKLETKKEYYKSLKSLVNKAIFREKSSYFNYNINNKLNNSKLLWNNLKNTLLPKNNTELPLTFNDPNVINQYFLNIPGTTEVSLSQMTYFEYNRFSDAVFHLEPVSLDRIILIIRNLKSKAQGSDGINLDLLYLTFPSTLECIKNLINTSIVTSTFPELWKTAIVQPLPKHSAPADLKDLRPISILPCLSKILEKAVCTQLTDYLEKYNIFPDEQSGFRKGRSTVTALLDVTDNILAAQDQGMCTLLVLLDFSRAFDSLNINLLLSKLSYYGFDRGSLRWFESYLTGRHQYVKLTRADGTTQESNRVPVNRGIPQGSILGPLLFILYTADMKSHIYNCKFHVYADDTQVYISFKPTEIDTAIAKINQDLERIAAWSMSNCLLLNPSKTKYLIFGTPHQLGKISQLNCVLLQNEPIERVYEARNLGLIMDCNLRFEKHISSSVSNCFYKLKLLYKIRPYIKEPLRISLVESLVLSKLNYMDTVFGPRLLAKTQKLIQRVQNACARFCFNIPYRAHVTPFLNQHSLLKMKHRRKLHLACLLFGVIKYCSPKYLYNKLSWRDTEKTQAIRQCSVQLSTQRYSSAAFRGSFRYSATKCWNNIPPPLRNLLSIYSFRSKLKKFLLSHQNVEETQRLDTSAI